MRKSCWGFGRYLDESGGRRQAGSLNDAGLLVGRSGEGERMRRPSALKPANCVALDAAVDGFVEPPHFAVQGSSRVKAGLSRGRYNAAFNVDPAQGQRNDRLTTG
jgi:hypothetical protein